MEDLNALELAAARAFREARYTDALRVYLYMADGDASLDAGYLAEKIAQCYELQHDKPAARYWYGRAIEENPQVNKKSIEGRARLGDEEYGSLLTI